MSVEWIEIGPCRIACGDCLEILPTLEAGSVDAVVTDPPYGLAEKLHGTGRGEWGKLYTEKDGFVWDQETPHWFTELALSFPEAIIWGGNYFNLPPARCWLLWDKMQEHSSGHAEMAWTNLDKPIRTYRFSRVQLASEGKEHPTQKPLSLMQWCIEFLPEAQTVLDPFMGSGTTGVACIRTGRKFIGIEKEEKYFQIAAKRLRQAWVEKQSELPFPKEETLTQRGLSYE